MDDFSLPLISGGQARLSASLSGKKGVLVVFWSGVCSHCARYDRYLSSFPERHPELGLTVVASRQGETAAQIHRVITDRRLTFPILHDLNGALAARWLTQYTPKAFLINSDCVLVYRGAIDNFKLPDDPAHLTYLEAAIEDFLAGRPLRQPETASFGCAIQSVYYQIPYPL
jgi:peroxiredoxin